MITRNLSNKELHETFVPPMLDVTGVAEEVLDIWPYVDSVPSSDLDGFIISDGLVEYVYRNSTEQFEHVLVATETADVFLVVVVDLFQIKIYGHHLVNLPKLYDLVA